MTAETSASPVRNGLAVAWDVIIAPRDAFTSLREHPQWLVAFVVVCVFGTIGAFLQTPAGVHIAQATVQNMIATDPNIASMSSEKQQNLINQSMAIQRWVWVAYPLIVLFGVLISSVVLLIANAIGRGAANFARLWALAMHVGIISLGLAYLYIGVIVAFRGGDSFNTQTDLLAVLPSLAWLAPGASPKLAAFLSNISVFSIWALWLIALGMTIVANVKRNVAIGTSVALFLISALFSTAFAR